MSMGQMHKVDLSQSLLILGLGRICPRQKFSRKRHPAELKVLSGIRSTVTGKIPMFEESSGSWCEATLPGNSSSQLLQVQEWTQEWIWGSHCFLYNWCRLLWSGRNFEASNRSAWNFLPCSREEIYTRILCLQTILRCKWVMAHPGTPSPSIVGLSGRNTQRPTAHYTQSCAPGTDCRHQMFMTSGNFLKVSFSELWLRLPH